MNDSDTIGACTPERVMKSTGWSREALESIGGAHFGVTPPFGEVTRAVTVDDLKALPVRSVIAGPQWRDEVYQKIHADEWLLLGSPDPWSSGSVVHRGPFSVLRSGK